MNEKQIQALADLVGQEIDRRTANIRSKAELDKILGKFAEGAGASTKKQIADVRDRLLGRIDELEARIAELEKAAKVPT